MKQSTKAQIEFKLLKWFRRLFNYTPFIQPYIIEERKIQKIVSEHIPTEVEKKVLSKERIEEITAHHLLKAMLQIKAIRFEWDTMENGMESVRAITYVPEKL